MAEDADTLVRARTQEFDRLYRRAAPQLVAALADSSGDRAGAEAAVQLAFARAWQHWEKVRTLPDPLAWVRDWALRLPRSPSAPTSMTSEDARARGERRRRRGRVLGGLSMLSLVAAVVLLLPGGGGDGPAPDVLPPPPRAPAEDPVRALLLDPTDLPEGPWLAREVGAELVLPLRCAPGVRFTLTPPAQGDEGTAARTLTGPDGASVGHAVLVFGSSERAEAAWDRLATALADCPAARPSVREQRLQAEGESGTDPFTAQRVGAVLSVVRAPGAGLPRWSDTAGLKVLTHSP